MNTVFYDLDGTLLPMDMDQFVNYYFGFLVKKAIPFGYEKDSLIKTIWGGTAMMVKNDGSKTNEDAFWEYFCKTLGRTVEEKALFEDFYKNEFDRAKDVCGFNPLVPKMIEEVKTLGLRQVLATNPIFPEVATKKRISWAGLKEEDFEAYTTYENCHYAKPNVKYYEELCKRVNVDPKDVLMIGNDVDEDMVAASIGMKVFLVTDCMINKSGKDINEFPHGDFNDALDYIKKNI